MVRAAFFRGVVGFGAAFGIGLALGGGCAAGANPVGPGGTGGSGAGTGGGLFVSSSGAGLDAMVPDGFGSCTNFSAEAKQAPAALMVILDGSASMNVSNKWGTAQAAIIKAIDKDVFDSMSLGLLTFPTLFEPPPQCLCSTLGIPPQNYSACVGLFAPGVSCGVSALAQIPVQPTGTQKSNGTSGVRHKIYDFLVGAKPLSNADDGSPIYAALVSGYGALKDVNVDKRIAVLITDGGFSCTSVANPPRPGYLDLNGCQDWEQPDSVNQLIGAARTDPSKPIETFIVGVPGANSHGEKQGAYDTPPYSMLLALSTYAVSGSPSTVDPGCNKGAMFMQNAPDPPKPCHIDLSNGASFNPDALATAIENIRGQALGCVYDLPPPPAGQTIDPSLVNVVVTIDGVQSTLPKRKDASDACLTEPCWDYDANQKVELIGLACTSLSKAMSAKVDIYVGCATVLK